VFGVVPLVILALNVLVIHETRRLSNEERRLHASMQMTTSRRLNSLRHAGGSVNAHRPAAPASAASVVSSLVVLQNKLKLRVFRLGHGKVGCLGFCSVCDGFS